MLRGGHESPSVQGILGYVVRLLEQPHGHDVQVLQAVLVKHLFAGHAVQDVPDCEVVEGPWWERMVRVGVKGQNECLDKEKSQKTLLCLT